MIERLPPQPRLSNDPFLSATRDLFRHHALQVGLAFLALTVSRAITFASLPDGAVKVATTVVGSLLDFIVAVVFLTLVRAFYGFPFIFVRKPLARVGNYVLFTLVFGAVFSLRSGQALGVQRTGDEVKIFYPFPKAAQVVPHKELKRPQIQSTSVATILRLPGDTVASTITFVPAYNVDTKAKNRLREIEAALK